MNEILYALIALISFLFIGTLVPSLVSSTSTVLVFIGFGLGIILAGAMVWCVYKLCLPFIVGDED
jgi:hypothetical protein